MVKLSHIALLHRFNPSLRLLLFRHKAASIIVCIVFLLRQPLVFFLCGLSSPNKLVYSFLNAGAVLLMLVIALLLDFLLFSLIGFFLVLDLR